jgi:outer membrane biosynthesis protein TonB
VLGSLSFAPGLAVAGLTTSVSFAAAMGGAQTLPPATPPPALVAMATATPAPIDATTRPRTPDANDPAPTAAPTEAPPPPTATPAPTPAPVVVAPAAPKAPVVHAPAPPPAPPAPKPAPAPASTCQQQFVSRYPQYATYAQWYCTNIYPQYGWNYTGSGYSGDHRWDGHIASRDATTSTGADQSR